MSAHRALRLGQPIMIIGGTESGRMGFARRLANAYPDHLVVTESSIAHMSAPVLLVRLNGRHVLVVEGLPVSAELHAALHELVGLRSVALANRALGCRRKVNGTVKVIVVATDEDIERFSIRPEHSTFDGFRIFSI